MSKKFNLKSAIEIAIAKEMDVPDEGTGLILHKFGSIIKQEEGDEFQEKRSSCEKDLTPTQAEMDMINASARIEQDPGNWYVFRNVNVTGPLDSVDSHGDIFALRAAKTMAEQVTPQEASPIITDHWHELGDRPPIGKAIAARASGKGLIETWAIPKEDYNASIVKGLLNGTINKISIGAFINPADKICNSCGNKSIYDSTCPHIPNRKDEKGNLVTVTIKDVKRYAERSLVNIPARLGTSVKSLAPELDTKEAYFSICDEVKEETPELPPVFIQLSKKLGANDPPLIYDLPLDYEDVYLQILVPEGKDLSGANDVGIQNFVTDKPLRAFKFNDTGMASSHILQTKKGEAFVPQIVIDHRLFPDNESVNEGNFVLSVYCSHRDVAPTPPATIPDVISEDSIVAEKDVKAPEAQEPSEKEEITAPEATAAEDKTEAQEEVKSIEVPVVKSLEVEELTKSFNGAIEVKTEELNKALAEVTEKLVKQQEFSEKQGEALKSLSDSVVALAENVAKLASLSTEEAVEKLLEVAGQIKEQTSAPKPQEPMTKFSFIDSLRK